MTLTLLLLIAVLLGFVLGAEIGHGLARSDISALTSEVQAAHDEADAHAASTAFWSESAHMQHEAAQGCYQRLRPLLRPMPHDVPAMEAGAWD